MNGVILFPSLYSTILTLLNIYFLVRYFAIAYNNFIIGCSSNLIGILKTSESVTIAIAKAVIKALIKNSATRLY